MAFLGEPSSLSGAGETSTINLSGGMDFGLWPAYQRKTNEVH